MSHLSKCRTHHNVALIIMSHLSKCRTYQVITKRFPAQVVLTIIISADCTWLSYLHWNYMIILTHVCTHYLAETSVSIPCLRCQNAASKCSTSLFCLLCKKQRPEYCLNKISVRLRFESYGFFQCPQSLSSPLCIADLSIFCRFDKTQHQDGDNTSASVSFAI